MKTVHNPSHPCGCYGWGEVERRAREHELVQAFGLPLVKIEVADRLRGCIVESLSMLEAGHTAAAQQILSKGYHM